MNSLHLLERQPQEGVKRMASVNDDQKLRHFLFIPFRFPGFKKIRVCGNGLISTGHECYQRCDAYECEGCVIRLWYK